MPLDCVFIPEKHLQRSTLAEQMILHQKCHMELTPVMPLHYIFNLFDIFQYFFLHKSLICLCDFYIVKSQCCSWHSAQECVVVSWCEPSRQLVTFRFVFYTQTGTWLQSWDPIGWELRAYGYNAPLSVNDAQPDASNLISKRTGLGNTHKTRS